MKGRIAPLLSGGTHTPTKQTATLANVAGGTPHPGSPPGATVRALVTHSRRVAAPCHVGAKQPPTRGVEPGRSVRPPRHALPTSRFAPGVQRPRSPTPPQRPAGRGRLGAARPPGLVNVSVLASALAPPMRGGRAATRTRRRRWHTSPSRLTGGWPVAATSWAIMAAMMIMAPRVLTLDARRPTAVAQLAWPYRVVPRRVAESRGRGALAPTAVGYS